MEAAALDGLAAVMEPHRDVARHYNAVIKRKAGVDIMGVDPLVRLDTEAEERLRVALAETQAQRRVREAAREVTPHPA